MAYLYKYSLYNYRYIIIILYYHNIEYSTMGLSPAGRGPPSPALPCTGPPGAEQVSPPLLHAVAWARGASPRLTPERLRKRSGVGGFGRGAGLGGAGGSHALWHSGHGMAYRPRPPLGGRFDGASRSSSRSELHGTEPHSCLSQDGYGAPRKRRWCSLLKRGHHRQKFSGIFGLHVPRHKVPATGRGLVPRGV